MRKLLTTSRVVVAAHNPGTAASALNLDGTLTVNYRAAMTSQNVDGSSTTTTPVKGQVEALGKVKGIWTQTADQLGDPTGYDTIRLHNSNSTIVVAMTDHNAGGAHSTGKDTVSYERAQEILDVPGAYAHASEKGTIELTMNKAKTSVASMTIDSKS